MVDGSRPRSRCGIDTVEIARVERWLRDASPDDLAGTFSPDELKDSGEGSARVASLAARFAAKEACLKLFPRETALGILGPADFAVWRDGYGAPNVVCSSSAREVLDRYRLKTIALSLTHDRTSASAIAVSEPAQTEVPLVGKLIFHLLPIRRRIVLSNLRRVFADVVSEAEIRRLAQAHYAHLGRLVVEFLTFSWLRAAQRTAMVRVENIEAILRAHARGKGVLVLTGHFGNWEVATVAGMAKFPQYKGLIHFLRRPLQPGWFDTLVTRRFRQAGLGTLPKKGALDAILERLGAGGVIVFVFDQYAAGSDGIAAEFFGHPAGTFRSLAILALGTGAPVIPAASWREPDGRHVLRFEEALPLIECEDVNEAIRKNTRAYNAALERLVLRHPEQWFWVHRRWKERA
jgi:phosphopantetheine--protein transferase-like protein